MYEENEFVDQQVSNSEESDGLSNSEESEGLYSDEYSGYSQGGIGCFSFKKVINMHKDESLAH